jgi:cell division protein FtsQ
MALRPLTAPATLLRGRRPVGAVRRRRKSRAAVWLRRLAAIGVLGLALAAAYMLWFRDSSLVAVKNVRIEGLSSITDPEVADSLERAARGMTTLHLDTRRLAAAVSGYPTVKALSVDAGFPSSLTITVTERVPVAVAGDSATPVAADGVLLPGVDTGHDELPALDASAGGGGELDAAGREQAGVIGAAPDAMTKVIDDAQMTSQGVEVELTGGISLLFGDASRAGDKWAAAARILADPAISALDYIDLRVADRPAVGGALPAGDVVPEVAPPG